MPQPAEDPRREGDPAGDPSRNPAEGRKEDGEGADPAARDAVGRATLMWTGEEDAEDEPSAAKA